MYYQDNKYFQCYSLIDDLAFQNLLLTQVFNENATMMDTIWSTYKVNAQTLLKLMFHQPGQENRQKQSQENIEQAILEVPSNMQTHLQNSLNSINEKNKIIIQQLLNVQQKLEIKAKRCKSLSLNMPKELQLKDEVLSIRKRTQSLNEKVSEFFQKIQFDDKQIKNPPQEQMQQLETESIQLLKNLKQDYKVQQNMLSKCELRISQFLESFE